MRRLETQTLERFNNSPIDPPDIFEVVVDGRKIDYDTLICNTPAVTSTYDGLNNPTLVLGAESGLPSWDEDKYYPVGRLDRIHGRTLEVLASEVFLKDQFGNQYASLNIKGCDFSNPYFMKSLTAARDYIIHGLQESIVMERVIRASRVLREHGVGTEYTCGLVLPESFPLDVQNQVIDDKKPVELPEFLDYLSASFAGQESNRNGRNSLEVKADMIDRFKDCDYLITYRAIDCPYRFGEICEKDKFESLKQFASDRFDGNFVSFIKDLEPEQFIKSFFANNLGANVGKMHNAGIRHSFLVDMNISAMGSIVDLDSCRGEALGLGDVPTSDKDEVDDVINCLATISFVMNKIKLNEGSALKNSIYRQRCTYTATETFLNSYLTSRFKTAEESTEFLGKTLLDSKNLNTVAYHANGTFMYLIAQQLFDAYHKISPTALSEAVIPNSQLITPELKRSTSFLKSVPAKYIRQAKADILESYVNIKDEDIEVSGQLPAHSQALAVIKSQLLERILDAEDKNEKARLSAAHLLFLVGCEFDRYKPRRQDRVAAVAESKAYLRNQTSALLERLSEPEPDAVGKYLSPLLNGKLAGLNLEDQIGSINITAEGEPPIDVLYLENDQQYLEVLEAFGINDSSVIELLGSKTIDSLAFGDEKARADSIILANYGMVQDIAAQTTEKHIAVTLLGPARVHVGQRPLVFISELAEAKPKIYVQDSFYLGKPKPNYTFDNLRAALAPSVYKNIIDAAFTERMIDPQLHLFPRTSQIALNGVKVVASANQVLFES